MDVKLPDVVEYLLDLISASIEDTNDVEVCNPSSTAMRLGVLRHLLRF